jgi:hypothetical protein
MELRILRISGIVFIISYCTWWFLPYTYGYMNQETQSLLSYGNSGAILSESHFISVFNWIIFVATNIAALGTMLCRKLFRFYYTILILLSVVTAPLWGMSVETAGGVFLGYISNLASGILFAFAYYSKASNKFY